MVHALFLSVIESGEETLLSFWMLLKMAVKKSLTSSSKVK